MLTGGGCAGGPRHTGALAATARSQFIAVLSARRGSNRCVQAPTARASCLLPPPLHQQGDEAAAVALLASEGERVIFQLGVTLNRLQVRLWGGCGIPWVCTAGCCVAPSKWIGSLSEG